ncbi:L-histidine N(alpha)-methyltransferase [Anaeromyxobacter sp. PSR-1]|uniref:L-histidine N(alpha)-methyltransferase n=1 Tax=unclassified Anaeromyxobacter TaxID=2620896 RepID=UPI0005DCCADF|nr:L-histidine N(alpha)-methyltransferase [Anaeromyxobacter sp. PSR-1]GAO02470.1 histidine-specific methyltransferase EgtD [Anaeromyxobacter sp. PSR-1]
MIGLGEAESGIAQRTEADRFLDDVLRGLAAPRKGIPPKWLYDARGSALYELICEQPEYYPARTELRILERHAPEVGEAIGPDALVFEYGVGSGRKTQLLLAALDRPAAFVPVDIAGEALAEAARQLEARFPGLPVRPVVADFTEPMALPGLDLPCARRLAFFPGSTIGNFDPPEAVALLRRMARDAGPGGGLLLGLDLPKDAGTLERAYDDARGITAAFDLNLLARIDRELEGDFRLSQFRHRSLWDPRLSRVEMHLESLQAQVVHVAGAPFTFREGETIHTESAYKWEPRAFDTLAAIAGWQLERAWADDRAWFSMRLYRRAG